MTQLSELAIDVADVASVTERREEILSAIKDHAGQVAYNLARLEGGDYGRRSFSTDRGEWTVKYEAGDLDFLLYEPRGGGKTYVVSTQQPAEPEPLAGALADYGQFIRGYNDYVATLDGLLDDVGDDFPPVETTDGVAAERDRLVERIRSCCDRMAGELHRYEGSDYGTFSARVDSTRWELKREHDSVSYLRAGGSGGIYLLSQYGPPSANDVREYAPQFRGFVDAYNDHVSELELELEQIEL